MEIRGAAAIARAATDAVRTQAVESTTTDVDALEGELRVAARRLYETRPTAVSLPNVLRYVFERTSDDDSEALCEPVVRATREFQRRLETAQSRLGRVGANRLRDGDTVMFHCHSTDVLAMVERAREQGLELSVVVKETRPRKQGRLTAGEVDDMGIPVTYIVDSAAHRCLDDVDHVCVGADGVVLQVEEVIVGNAYS